MLDLNRSTQSYDFLCAITALYTFPTRVGRPIFFDTRHFRLAAHNHPSNLDNWTCVAPVRAADLAKLPPRVKRSTYRNFACSLVTNSGRAKENLLIQSIKPRPY